MSSNVERYRITKLLVQTLLMQILIVQRASAAVAGHKEDYQSSAAGEGLYSTSDGIFILNATNLKSNIYESKTAWLVEFYNSWCGYCHRFAPTWKALAQDIEHWKDIVVIAAMDCANDDNNPVCRDFEVMHYPMLKFFSVDVKVGNLGIELDSGKDMNTIRHNLVNRLEKEQQEGRGTTWPNIAPYRSSDTKNLWKDIPESVKYNFLIFEVVDSYLATEVTLDLHKFGGLQVRGVTSENEPLTISLGVNKFPTVIALGRDGTQQTINARYLTREGLRKAIKDFLMLKGIVIDIPGNPDNHSTDGTLTKSTEALNQIEEAKDKKELEEIRTFGDVLFQLDLETALRYSIEHEIPMSKVIDGEKLEALKAYLNVLAKHFPLRRSGVLFLDALREIIDRRTSLSGVELRQIVKSVEEEMSPIYSGPKSWIGCKGSMEHLRGYPCGLWTMFHMLTVNAANHNKNIKEYPPQEVLRAMYSYIKNFFGCSDCSQHFLEMAAKDKMFQVQTIDEAILWLWRSHNRVNKRLAGDETEDPEYKKIQYPSKEQCSACRYSNSSWNEVQVLHYMYRKYSYTGINYYNSSGKPDDDDTGDDLKIRQGRFALDKYTSQRRLGWDFTIFDISICVVLYVMSATILVLVCIKFAVKRTYRKKTYIHDLFGKV